MAGTLNDEILRVTGGPTVNDGLLAYYHAAGATAETLNDATRQWLLIVTAPPDPEAYTDNDLWALIPGLTGTINDRMLQYWSAL